MFALNTFLPFDDTYQIINKNKKNPKMKKDYLIRSGALMGFDDLVNELGGDSGSLLAKVNISAYQLVDGDTMIPFEAMVMLLEHAAHDLNCPSFGLQLSTHQDLQALGNLGLLMKNCLTARDAILCAQRYMALHSPAEYWNLVEEECFSYINRFEHFHGISHARQYKELSFGLCLRLSNLLIGEHFRGIRLEFSHKPISDLKYYKQFFSMDVSFNQEHNRIILDNQFLSQPITGFNQQVRRQTEEYLSQLMALHGDDIEGQVRTLILQTMGIQEHTLDNIASLLNLHKRTLQRKLKDKNLNFKTMLNEIRIRNACWHLEASNIDITLLSEILGYSDISAFSRAFKSQMQCSALQWRKQARLSVQ